MTAARWLLGLISAVVVAFVLATVVSEHIEDAISDRTQDIVSNAMPSVKWLTRALGTLDRLDYDLDQYALVPRDRRSAFFDQIASDRSALARDLAGYEALPRYPGEAALYAAVKSDREDLNALLDAALVHGIPRCWTACIKTWTTSSSRCSASWNTTPSRACGEGRRSRASAGGRADSSSCSTA